MSWNSLPTEIQLQTLEELIYSFSDDESEYHKSKSIWRTTVTCCVLVCKKWNLMITSELTKKTPTGPVLWNLWEAISFKTIKERLSLAKQSGINHDLRKLSPEIDDAKSQTELDIKNLWLEVVIERGFETCVRLLLDEGADVNNNNADLDKMTPIEIAWQNQKFSVAEVLLEYGTEFRNVDMITYDTPYYNAGSCLLWAAARYNLMSLAVKVLDCGFPINEHDKYRTPLCVALFYQHIDIAMFLLDKGASLLNGEEDAHLTPLFVAAKNCTLETVSMLVDRGADVNWQCWEGDALSAAIPRDKTISRFLISKGAIVTIRHLRLTISLFSKISISFIEFVASKLEGSDALAPGLVALDIAAEEGTEELVKVFLNKGVKPQSLNLKAISNGHISIVKALLDAGADPNTIPGGEEEEEKGNSLYRAASIGSVELAELLLDKGVPIDSVSGKCRSAVMAAAFHGNIKVLEVLRSRGGKLITDDEEWGSALDAAERGGQQHMMYIFKDFEEFDIAEDVETPYTPISSDSDSVLNYLTDLVG